MKLNEIDDAVLGIARKETKQVSQFVSDFKSFALKGNVIDLATGVIIGAAFGKIVTSLVDDILMPPLGLLVGKVDFSELFWVLHTKEGAPGPFNTMAQAKAAGATTWNYGIFLNTMLQFLIIALAIFILVSQIKKLQRREEAKDAATAAQKAASAPPPPTPPQEVLLTEIRDLLKNQNKTTPLA